MMNWNLVKALLFKLDAEKAHNLSVSLIRALGQISPHLLESLSSPHSWGVAEVNGLPLDFKIPQEFCGKKITAPLGLAAGFDKNALLVPYLPYLGFSAVEIGSVTLRAQEGNPKPRLFRSEQALFNCMGFNNDGAEEVTKRLEESGLPDDFVLGVNLGLNKTTPHENAAKEYAECFSLLKNLGDYFVVNVSSPNTPGLRDLQSLKNLEKIFSALKAVSCEKKIFLKLAPELSPSDREEIYLKAGEVGIDGFVLCNTLRGELKSRDLTFSGGWSGLPLVQLSRSLLEEAKNKTALPIISVGGVNTLDEFLTRVKMGASLVQIYTSWIFNGPAFPPHIQRVLKHARQ
jgi:dihydroorotate dehydrogenase